MEEGVEGHFFFGFLWFLFWGKVTELCIYSIFLYNYFFDIKERNYKDKRNK